MKAFENIEIATVGMPTPKDVLERVESDEPCGANPASDLCTFNVGKDDYLLGDMAREAVCERCPLFERRRHKLENDWEEYVLALQDVYG